MKENLIYGFILTALLFYMTGTNIQLQPFKITFDHLSRTIGWILIVAGILFIEYDVRKTTITESIDVLKTEVQKLSDKININDIEND